MVLHSKTTTGHACHTPKDPYGVGHAALQPPAGPSLPHLTAPLENEGDMDPHGSPSQEIQSCTEGRLSWPPWVHKLPQDTCGDIQA